MRRATFIIAIMLLPAIAMGADLANGRRLYRDPSLGGGTSGKCCLTCHEQGRDLGADLDQRRTFTVMENPVGDLAGAVNFCIEVALRGQEIDPQGQEMADLTSYLAWLGKNKRDPLLPATLTCQP
ncbi:MAG: hypothetical protein ACOY8P_07100 [Thermodesulfobacteriota bacterium]|jgi:hypothetical protein